MNDDIVSKLSDDSTVKDRPTFLLIPPLPNPLLHKFVEAREEKSVTKATALRQKILETQGQDFFNREIREIRGQKPTAEKTDILLPSFFSACFAVKNPLLHRFSGSVRLRAQKSTLIHFDRPRLGFDWL
jgi:hypothetical protein